MALASVFAAACCAYGGSILFDYNHVQRIIYGTSIDNGVNTQPPKAIVVFAGDHGRICHGVSLLQSQPQSHLYISGHPELYTHEGIEQHCGISFPLDDFARVTADIAVNTYDNALRSAQWLYDHHYNDVQLVTSAFHMPRSVLELGRTFNGQIQAVPVTTTTNNEILYNESFKFFVRLAKVPVPRDYQFSNI